MDGSLLQKCLRSLNFLLFFRRIETRIYGKRRCSFMLLAEQLLDCSFVSHVFNIRRFTYFNFSVLLKMRTSLSIQRSKIG